MRKMYDKSQLKAQDITTTAQLISKPCDAAKTAI